MTTTVRRRRLLPGLDQLALRSVVVVGALATLGAAVAAGATAPIWVAAALLLLALATAVVPDSSAPALLLLAQAYLWLLTPSAASPWVLLAALGMVLAHVAAMVAAQGPATMPVDPGAVRRWAGRAGAVALAGVPVWVLVVLLRHAPGERLVYLAGLVVLIAGAVGTARWISTSRDPA